MTEATAATDRNDLVQIPLDRLVEAPNNVRKTRSPAFIERLAATIDEAGLFQNLVVQLAADDNYLVIAGENRRQALLLLADRGKLSLDHAVPCLIRDKSALATSLAENDVREAMSPADQFEAFRDLYDNEGLTVDQIAHQFGLTATLVEKRLKLGRLAPPLLDALRLGELSLEAAAAFTITDDQARQLSVYDAVKNHRNGPTPRVIKSALTEDELPGTDKLAIFVGEAAYEAAGGTIRRDLFDDECWFADPDLLTRLANEKLASEAELLMADKKWLWIEFAFDQDHNAGRNMRRLYPSKQRLSKDDRQKKKDLEDDLSKLADTEDDDGKSDQLQSQLDEIADREYGFSRSDRKIAGGFLSLGYNGKVISELGFVRTADDPTIKEQEADAATGSASSAGGYSKALREDLAAIRLEAMRDCFLSHADIASDLLHFHLIRQVLRRSYTSCPFDLNCVSPVGAATESSRGDMGLYEGRETTESMIASLSFDWYEHEDIGVSFDGYRALDQEMKAQLVTYAASLMLKPQLADDKHAEPTLEHALLSMKFAPADYWTPGMAFFERLKKDQIVDVAKSVIDDKFAGTINGGKKQGMARALGSAFVPDQDQTSRFDQETRERLQRWSPGCMRPVSLEDAVVDQ